MQENLESPLHSMKNNQNVVLNSRFILICHMTYGGPKLIKIIKHEQPGTEFWQIIPVTICHPTFVGKIKFWTNKG